MQNEFSTVDGFVEISECLAEMIKYIANEPSLGLFYIQKHTQSAVSNVVKINNNVKEKSHDTTLHAEDLEDSISMVKSMKKCGPSIADEMIGDIKKSLLTLKTKQPKRGLIHNSTSDFQTAGTSSSSSLDKYFSYQGSGERSRNYLSTVFQSTKQGASGFKWPQFDFTGETLDLYPHPPLSVTSASTGSSLGGTEADALALSTLPGNESKHEGDAEINNLNFNVVSISQNYDDFKAGKEAQLEEWLEGTGRNLDNL